MGTFSVRFTVRHPVHGNQQRELDGLVDSGALFSQIPTDVLTQIGITPSGTRAVHDADGTRDVVPVAKADIAVDGVETATVVLCGRPGSLVLLGATTLETLGLGVDPIHKKLIPIEAPMAAAGGPLPARRPRRRIAAYREEGAMHYSRISADCHIDMPWIPDDLFTANASAAMRDRMPYVTDGPDGPFWTCKNGMSFGLVGGVGPSGQKLVPGQNYRVDKMAAVGLYEDGKKGIRRPTDPHLRLKDMELDGVQAEVIFGILGAATRLNDHAAAREMFRIYNDWLADFCRHYPDRQIGLACLPYGDIDAAVQEVHRVAKLGLRGLELSCSWDMEPMWHEVWDPLWQAVSEVNLPLHFHTFPSTPPELREKATTQRARRASLFTGVSAFQMNLVNILAAVIGAAVLERYPKLRIAFGESGIGWIPYALDRMDFEWEDRFRDIGLTMKPSDYWRRQCKATFQFDRIGTKMIDEMGAETLMWASDYPHTDGVWPESSKYIEEQFGHLPADVVRKITCENAGKFYGLM